MAGPPFIPALGMNVETTLIATDLATNAVCAAIALVVLVLAARKARVQPAGG